MKISDFISITKNFVFGKGNLYSASIGEISANGKKPLEAINSLKLEIEKLAKNHCKIKVIPTKNPNSVFVVRWQFGGWQYDIVDLTTGKSSSCLLGNDYDWKSACISAQNHAKDYY